MVNKMKITGKFDELTGLGLGFVYSLGLVWFHNSGKMDHTLLLSIMVLINCIAGFFIGKMVKQIRFYGLTDPLTKICNRRCFMDKLAKVIKSAREKQQELAIVMVDLDNFKKCNDELGHDVGDRVLFLTAQTIAGNLPEEAFVGRLGGDEFSIVFTDTTKTEAAFLVEQISKKVDEVLREYNVSISYGIASFPNDSSDFRKVFKLADEAMYSMKKAKRTRTRENS